MKNCTILLWLFVSFAANAQESITFEKLEEMGSIRKATPEEIAEYKSVYNRVGGKVYVVLKPTRLPEDFNAYYILPNGFDKESFISREHFVFYDAESKQCYAEDRVSTAKECKKIWEYLGSGQRVMNIPRPVPSDGLYDEKNRIYLENAFVDSLLQMRAKEAARILNIEKLNMLGMEYAEAIQSGQDDKEAFETYRKGLGKICVGCIRENFVKDFISAGITAEKSPQCKSILTSTKFLDRVDKINFTDTDGTSYEFRTTYEGTMGFPTAHLTVNGHEQLVYYPIFWTGRVGYFELDGKLYHTDSDRGATVFDIFEFVPEYSHFKEVCKITADILAYDVVLGEDNPICKDISEGKYKTYEVDFITDLMTENEYEIYHKDMCAASATYGGSWNEDKSRKEELAGQRNENCLANDDVEDYPLASETNGGFKAIKVDYNNDGEQEYLISSSYSSGSGAGCGITHFRVYDPKIQNTRLITTGKVYDVYFHGGNTGDGYTISCLGGYQRIIEVEKRNYLLTLNAEGIEQLHQVTTQEDGTNRITRLCGFKTVLIYK